jgi:hypothetical protein
MVWKLETREVSEQRGLWLVELVGSSEVMHGRLYVQRLTCIEEISLSLWISITSCPGEEQAGDEAQVLRIRDENARM